MSVLRQRFTKRRARREPRAQTKRFRVIQICVYRRDDDPGIDLHEVDPGDRDTAPAIDDDALIQDSIKHIEEVAAYQVALSSHASRVRASRAKFRGQRGKDTSSGQQNDDDS